MKIAGIAGAKHPSKKKGDPIELSPEDKLRAISKEQVAEDSPEGTKRIPIDVEVIGDVRVIDGRHAGDDSTPAQYMGEAVVKYRTLHLHNDRMTPAKKVQIKIHFKDCKNDIGVPDLEVVSMEELKHFK